MKMQVAQTQEPLDEIQTMLRDSVQGFAQRNPGAPRIRAMRDKAAADTWPALAEAGWLGIIVPESVGGLGLGLRAHCAVAEELGAGLAPETFVADNLAIELLAMAEDAQLVERRLPSLIDGTARLALAWQEGVNALDPLDISTTADGGMLNGVKKAVPGAATADAFLVTALRDGKLELYRIDKTQPGVTVSLQATVDGVALGTLSLADVAVTADHRVMADAGATLRRALDRARLAAAAALFGLTRRALVITVEYCRGREQFGKPIGSFQSLQHRMVDMWMQQEITRNILAHSLSVFETSDDETALAAAASAAKAQASHAAMLVARQGIQLHGGVGYADEYDIGLFLKRAIVLSGWLGNATLHRRRYVANATGFAGQA